MINSAGSLYSAYKWDSGATAKWNTVGTKSNQINPKPYHKIAMKIYKGEYLCLWNAGHFFSAYTGAPKVFDKYSV